MAERGRPNKITDQHVAVLKDITTSRPHSTLNELVAIFKEKTGIQTHSATLAKALAGAGITRQKGTRAGDDPDKPAQPKAVRYGYTQNHRPDLPEQGYSSGLTDAEWLLVKDIFDPAGRQGAPARWSRRAILDACCYVVRTGCAWRMLPNDFPDWDNVYKTFRRWSEQGRFERMHDLLRQQWREREGHAAEPTAAVLDSQSTRISPQGGASGFDAGKKVKGRKRNLVVDTMGLLLAVTVTTANTQDRDAGTDVVAHAARKYPALTHLYADGAYAGKWAQLIEATHQIKVEIVRHPASRNVGTWCQPGQMDLFDPTPTNGFTVLPKRWVVERTHAWNERARRLIMHHDRRISVSVAWVWLAEARLLSRRLVA